ncbi:uncharacterized protein LOC119391746 [Rhipicephalus sanguineus]|uniref:uncharacterized protein LOC119391746 n=1 Tax=Rhipicephalus sanguineus TaxID=34632 RepID=UPI0020C26FFC|nr:uncharacterized protein LOC119391746 [Rhipicephalus sanguineus]
MKKKKMNPLVLVAAFALPFSEAFTWAVNPNYYEIGSCALKKARDLGVAITKPVQVIETRAWRRPCGQLQLVGIAVSLNDFCDNKENKKDLRNTSQSKSAAIVTATQFRDMRGSIKDGCSIDLSTKGTAGLIVSLVEMNLRSGVLNRSCIDYVNIVTKFHIPSDKDERCGRVRADEYRYFATSQSLQLRLHSRTPLSTFFEGYTLAVVVTSFTEASSHDGGCAPHEFQCVAGGRCIYKHYQCDNINNCGDNSDEEQLGNSMCLMPLSSLVLITTGTVQFAVTWLLVLCCCIRSALSSKKAVLEDRTDTETLQNPSSAAAPPRRSTVSLEDNEPGGVSEEVQSEAMTPEAEAPLSGLSPVAQAKRSIPRPYRGPLFSSMMRKTEPEEQVPLSPTS